MDIIETRRRAIAARRLLEDADLTALLAEIEADAAMRLLRSGGNPDALRDAWSLAQVPETLRARLQTRLADERAADKREQRS